MMTMKWMIYRSDGAATDSGGGGGAGEGAAGNGAAGNGAAGAGAAGNGAAGAGAGVATASDWRSQLPPELAADPSIAKFTEVKTLAQSYLNAQKLIGRDKIPMPTNDVEMREVLKRLGLPDDTSGYDFKGVEMPENFQLPDATQAHIRKTAHELGLTNTQARQLLKTFADNAVEAQSHADRQASEFKTSSETELRKEYGQAYDKNIELARRAAKQFGGDGILKLLGETRLGDNPAIIKMFATIGTKMMEDGLINRGELPRGLSPSDIAGEIAKTMGHPAYTDRKHPEHNVMVKKASDLFALKNMG